MAGWLKRVEHTPHCGSIEALSVELGTVRFISEISVPQTVYERRTHLLIVGVLLFSTNLTGV
ncbi:hypothetical protein [Gordonia aichiensis]